jgi:hypothetical protein
MTGPHAPWRKASFSDNNSNCVEVAAVPGHDVAVRNSNRPEAGTVTIAAAGFGSFLDAVRAGMMDDLT